MSADDATRASRRAAYEATVEATAAVIRRGVETPVQRALRAGNQWFVAHTHPYQEPAVLGRLLELGLEAVLPRIPQVRQRAVQPWREAVRYVPLYPCYMFVPMDLESLAWRVALTLPGMRRFLGEGFERPIPITSDFVEFSLAVAEARVTEIENSSRKGTMFEPGDQVQVLNGAFADHQGIVEMPGLARVAIMLQVFDRKVKTMVAARDLKLIAT